MTIKVFRTLLLGFVVSLFALTSDGVSSFATCTGSASCRACTNCRYCAHCAKRGGSCGVCKKGKAHNHSEGSALDESPAGSVVVDFTGDNQ